MRSSVDVNAFQWNREWFFSRRVMCHWVQRDGGIWSFLKWTKNHFALHRRRDMSLEVVEVETLLETLLIILHNFFDLLLELGGPVSRWMFSVPDLLQQILFVHLRLEICFSILGEILLLLRWVFLCRLPMRPSFPAPQCLQPWCHPSKFTPRTERIQGTIQERLSFQIHGFLTGLSQK